MNRFLCYTAGSVGTFTVAYFSVSRYDSTGEVCPFNKEIDNVTGNSEDRLIYTSKAPVGYNPTCSNFS
ncbi:MAG: hypothetical protein PHG66_04720 [Candidatus Colwellbacteria bacterium]|nr:hypothetical protein [Candidatus Colwellbacteria bacterium]